MAQNSLAVIALIMASLVCFTLALPSPGGDHKDLPMVDAKCAGEDWKKIDKPDEIHQMAMTCMNSTNSSAAGGKADPDHLCVHICLAQKMGILDAKGAVVANAANAKLESLAPAAKLADMKKALDTCIKDHGSSLDATKCESYKPIIECGHKALVTICEWKDKATPAASG